MSSLVDLTLSNRFSFGYKIPRVYEKTRLLSLVYERLAELGHTDVADPVLVRFLQDIPIRPQAYNAMYRGYNNPYTASRTPDLGKLIIQHIYQPTDPEYTATYVAVNLAQLGFPPGPVDTEMKTYAPEEYERLRMTHQRGFSSARDLFNKIREYGLRPCNVITAALLLLTGVRMSSSRMILLTEPFLTIAGTNGYYELRHDETAPSGFRFNTCTEIASKPEERIVRELFTGQEDWTLPANFLDLQILLEIDPGMRAQRFFGEHAIRVPGVENISFTIPPHLRFNPMPLMA